MYASTFCVIYRFRESENFLPDMYSRSYSQIDRRIFMKTKSKLLLIAALFSAFVFAFGGLSLSVYAAEENVNGWVATAPSGAAANYGSNIGWVQAPTAGENGFTNSITIRLLRTKRHSI